MNISGLSLEAMRSRSALPGPTCVSLRGCRAFLGISCMTAATRRTPNALRGRSRFNYRIRPVRHDLWARTTGYRVSSETKGGNPLLVLFGPFDLRVRPSLPRGGWTFARRRGRRKALGLGGNRGGPGPASRILQTAQRLNGSPSQGCQRRSSRGQVPEHLFCNQNLTDVRAFLSVSLPTHAPLGFPQKVRWRVRIAVLLHLCQNWALCGDLVPGRVGPGSPIPSGLSVEGP